MSANEITQKSGLNLLYSLGQELYALGGDIYRESTIQMGFRERNSGYKRLSPDTPLYINHQPHVIKKSQSAGEKDLVALANEVPYEGAWIFTPQDQNWYHTSVSSKEEYSENVTRASCVPLPENFELKIPGNEIVHYHTHPKKAALHTIDRFRYERADSPPLGKLEEGLLNLASYFHTCFPSVEDLIFYRMMKEQLGERVIFTGSIASPFGITSIDLVEPTEDTISLYEQFQCTFFDVFYKNILGWEETDEGPEIGIYEKDLFDSVNTEMKGKLKLTFHPADTYHSFLKELETSVNGF